jgi:hypothetical protein
MPVRALTSHAPPPHHIHTHMRTFRLLKQWLILAEVMAAVTGGRLSLFYVRFEVFTVVTMKNGVVWNVTPCGSCKN